MKKYLINILLWLDEGINVFTFGDPGERVSSRAGKAKKEGKRWACLLCRTLDLIQKDHCEKSINPNVGNQSIIPD